MTYRQFSNEVGQAAKKAGIKTITTQQGFNYYKLLAKNGNMCYDYTVDKLEPISDFRSFIQDLFL